jgi:hypothetical protein
MVSEYEAAKLRREMHEELNGAYTTLVKCAVGIVVLVTLAIVSPTLGLEQNGVPQTASVNTTSE